LTTKQISEDRTPATNTGLAKVAVQYSADTFVVNQSLVLCINICGENRHLRQASSKQQNLDALSILQNSGIYILQAQTTQGEQFTKKFVYKK